MITPRILKGTRDFLPEQMARRNYVRQKIEAIFKSFAYSPMETPVIEYAETILGKVGEDGNKQIYTFDDNGGRQIALRFDQTVPLARFVSMYAGDLPMPFKRYEINRVWRAEKPQKGRLREFYQCDIDVIGTESLIADADIAKTVDTVFRELGFSDYVITVNSRRLMNALLGSYGIEAVDAPAIIRSIDKKDKIGMPAVKKELVALGISPDTVDQLLQRLEKKATNEETLALFDDLDVSEMSDFLTLAQQYGIDAEKIVFDPSLARGLDYYTGIVYEVVIPGTDYGSLCGGGRYDDLAGLFSKKNYPGVGVAFGFERIMLVMEERGMLDTISVPTDILVTIFDDQCVADSLKIYSMLTDAGINSEVYIEPSKLAKQFKYADRKKIPFVVVQGPDESANGSVTIRIMESGKQKTIPVSQLVAYISSLT